MTKHEMTVQFDPNFGYNWSAMDAVYSSLKDTNEFKLLKEETLANPMALVEDTTAEVLKDCPNASNFRITNVIRIN